MPGKQSLNSSLVHGPRLITALFVATAGGAGLLPKTPAAFGTLVGVSIAYFTRDWPIAARLGLWGAILAVGTWSAEVFDRTMQSTDSRNIVIDEVLGMGITAWITPDSLRAWIAAFFLFRLFDIWKPYPIRLLDRWSKKNPGMSGFGVMADDILAGIYGLITMIVLRSTFPWLC